MMGAVGVLLKDAQNHQVVTRLVTDLEFRKTAPGGHTSMSCNIDLSHDVFPTLGPNDKIIVFDVRTGDKLWEGFTENPGLVSGADGRGYSLSAAGAMSLAQDHSTPVVFIERSLDDSLWTRLQDTGGTVEAGGAAGTDLKFQFSSGMPVAQFTQTAAAYMGISRTNQNILSIEGTRVGGKVDAGWTTEINPVDAGVGIYQAASASLTTTSNTFSAVAVTDFPTTCEQVWLRIYRGGTATNVIDDNVYVTFKAPYIRAALTDATGLAITTPGTYLTYAVRAHEVVNHLLGTVLSAYKPEQVDPCATWITQLTYHDGAKPADILDDLALYEPNVLWEALEADAYGKFRFRYRTWPTTVRYDVSTSDAFAATGGEVDLCNRVVVYWQDEADQKQGTVVTSVVPELAGRVRDAEPITLAAGQGSLANAQAIGAAVLASKSAAVKSGTATIRRPILDRLHGTTVMPWEIEPGYVVRVQESGDLYRLTETNYVDDDVACALTLGNPVPTLEQMLIKTGIR